MLIYFSILKRIINFLEHNIHHKHSANKQLLTGEVDGGKFN